MSPNSALFTFTRRRLVGKSFFVHGRRRHHRCRFFSSQPLPLPDIEYPLSHPIYTIWAANTGLGKTLVAAGLAASFLSSKSTKYIYLKPVQTGYPNDSDSHFVYNKFSELFYHWHPKVSAFASNHILKASIPAAEAVLGSGSFGGSEDKENCESGFKSLGWYEERKLLGENGELGMSELLCKTMYGWREAVSPHLAAEREDAAVGDSELLEMLKRCLWMDSESGHEEGKEVLSVIETAGGVASPGPSGSLQCDLYRPFRFPAILVGDGRLGGISGTISAYESLKLRGYDVVSVVFEDYGLENEIPLRSYLRSRVPLLVLPSIPKDMSDNLIGWFGDAENLFSSLKEIMVSAFHDRRHRLHEMPNKAQNILWWPFTQHKLVPEKSITVIDSRCGENFAVHKVQSHDFMTQQFDACASWWTQGPDATLQIELARDMGYAASRFGHVMFPENVYEPVLECAELMLEGVGKGWASRAYFSDNGSTAIEISIKMAFRKYLLDHGISFDSQKNSPCERCIELMVLALTGSYHGDTLGAMEAQAPSSYTGFLQQPWYTGRGLFLNPPTVFMSNGIWRLSLPEHLDTEKPKVEDSSFYMREELFDKNRDNSSLADTYLSYISQELSRYLLSEGSTHIGALIMEPVIQGAGGMQMVDPLFQRVLVKECQSRNIPVIFDEVFTGFWRLGVESAAELLCCQPDISCFAKLMTGGIVPLAATLATEAVFNAFLGDSKLKALLHGHSYTAHAMGCTAAVKSIKWYKDAEMNFNFISEKRSLRELWDMELVHQISSLPAVRRVVTVGTLFSVELQAEGSDVGYASLYASSLIQKLREDGIYTRPLGNVIYLMCGPCTHPLVCQRLLNKFYRILENFCQGFENTRVKMYS